MDIAAESLGLDDRSRKDHHSRADHIGIWASVLCAVHCALTPVLLILLPTFGKTWAHPATHWGMALIVIPIAVFVVRKGYKKHARKWVVAVGGLGIALIVIGAILPYVESGERSSKSEKAEGHVILPSASKSDVQGETAPFG